MDASFVLFLVIIAVKERSSPFEILKKTQMLASPSLKQTPQFAPQP